METIIHRASERGSGEYGWLSTRYSFSFANWYNPARMGFGALRVLNDDVIASSSGFGMHTHQDMEIITIVMQGAVTHEDSMGNMKSVSAGEVQVMSAGTGVAHAERNASKTVPLELFQLWISPRERGVVPRYEQKTFTDSSALLVSPDGREGSLSIGQNAFISRVRLAPPQAQAYTLFGSAHGAYIVVVSGSVTVGDTTLGARYAVGISGVDTITMTAHDSAELLVIEVPML